MIYLDHNATTPLDPAVASVVDETARTVWGNPSSVHRLGQAAFAKLENARQVFAEILRVDPTECFFTSGGTESDNLAIGGVLSTYPDGNIVISSIEHPAVAECAAYWMCRGYGVRVVPVDAQGIVDVGALEGMIDSQTRLVSIMSANNETGTIQPLADIGHICQSKDIPFHSDAVQSFGKIPLDLLSDNISLLSLSAHKIGGPRGTGLLYVKKKTPFTTVSHGGGQELGMRAGTQNLPAIAGFAHAAKSVSADFSFQSELIKMIEELWENLSVRIPGIMRNGHPQLRLAGTLNVCIPGAPAEMLVQSLDLEGLCVSAGSACSSGAFEPSSVLMAMGRRKQEALCSFRISAGKGTTREELKTASDLIVSCVEKVKF